jgi:hypothetical protein
MSVSVSFFSIYKTFIAITRISFREPILIYFPSKDFSLSLSLFLAAIKNSLFRAFQVFINALMLWRYSILFWNKWHFSSPANFSLFASNCFQKSFFRPFFFAELNIFLITCPRYDRRVYHSSDFNASLRPKIFFDKIFKMVMVSDQLTFLSFCLLPFFGLSFFLFLLSLFVRLQRNYNL